MKMKPIYLFLLLFSFLFTSGNISAKVTEAVAKQSLESFFSFCKKNDFSNAAKFLAYSGSDNSRVYSDFFNPNNPDELKEIKRIAKKVNATLLISDSYSFGKFRNRIINKKQFQSLEVIFFSGKQKIKRQILFLEIKGKPAIFDYN